MKKKENEINLLLNYNIVSIFYCLHVTQYYFVKGLFPRVREKHCVYTSLHEYVTTISMFYLRHGASPVGNFAALASAKVANRTTIDEVILI